jgi:5,10-methylene-tetrahydrofolate dehydrogenase/methenyl tetrahydrofolate cyclohydrolase
MLKSDLFYSMHPRVLVDVGTAEQDGTVTGDVSAELRQSALDNGWRVTPRSGGVGPLTVRMLLSNIVQAAEEQARVAA